MIALISISFAVLLAFIFFSNFIFKKKLDITDAKLHLFKADRAKVFLLVETIAIGGFILFSLTYGDRYIEKGVNGGV